jgi:hypothetical protein
VVAGGGGDGQVLRVGDVVNPERRPEDQVLKRRNPLFLGSEYSFVGRVVFILKVSRCCVTSGATLPDQNEKYDGEIERTQIIFKKRNV